MNAFSIVTTGRTMAGIKYDSKKKSNFNFKYVNI
jgi:hypothetical protein